jgi:lysophospholipase L1-like esterase
MAGTDPSGTAPFTRRRRGSQRPLPGAIALLLVALLMAVIAAMAISTTGRLIYATGAGLAIVLLAGRWGQAHGLGAALLVVLAVQPAVAVALTPPIRHLIPNRTYVIESEIAGVRSGSVITIDERGFRPTSAIRPEDSAQRIVLIGGSTFEQIYVDDRATTGWLLADHPDVRGRGIEVINTGLAGLRAADHLTHLEHFDRSADRYASTLYVVMLGVNDWNMHLTREVLGLPSAWDGPAQPRWRRVESYPLVSVAIDVRARLLPEPPELVAAHTLGTYDGRTKVAVDGPTLARILELHRAELAPLFAQCERDPASHCLFVTQPTVYRDDNLARAEVRASLWLTPPFVPDVAIDAPSLVRVARAFNDLLLEEVARGSCTRCSSLDADALLEGRPDLFYDDVHFTELGAAALAQVLAGAEAFTAALP